MDKKVVAIFNNHDNAECAVRSLLDHGYNRADISIVTSRDIAYYDTPENQRDGITTGSAFGAVTGLLLSIGVFSVPGLGFLAAAGPIASFLTGAAAGGLIGSFIDFGISGGDTSEYIGQIKEGKIFFSIDVPVNSTAEVCSLLEGIGAERVNIQM